MRSEASSLRRVLLVVGGVVVLAAAFVGGYMVFRTVLTDGRSPAGNSPAPADSSSSTAPVSTTISSPAEPANFVASRPGLGDHWEQVLDVLPDRLPAPFGPPVDSRHGTTDCFPSYRAVRASGSQDAASTQVVIAVHPKSFEEVTITSLRVRVLLSQPIFSRPRYAYSCANPNASPGFRPDISLSAHRSEVSEAVEVNGSRLPQTVSAERAQVWQAVVSVDVLGKVYKWQIEIDYTNRGKSYTKIITEDLDGNAFITEAAQRAVDFDGGFVWCVDPEPARFRPTDECHGR